MQLKMTEDQQNSLKFDKAKLQKLLETENDYIVDLLTTFDVPDSIEGECLLSSQISECTLNYSHFIFKY